MSSQNCRRSWRRSPRARTPRTGRIRDRRGDRPAGAEDRDQGGVRGVRRATAGAGAGQGPLRGGCPVKTAGALGDDLRGRGHRGRVEFVTDEAIALLAPRIGTRAACAASGVPQLEQELAKARFVVDVQSKLQALLETISEGADTADGSNS